MYRNVVLFLQDKKSLQEKERQKRIEEAEAENVHSARNVEQEKLNSMLIPMGLIIKEVRSHLGRT
jgi:hypothetical protein